MLALAVLLAICVVPAKPSGATTEGRSFVLWAGPKFQRIGDFRVGRDPTYRGAIAAFGKASSCRLLGGSPSSAEAIWRGLGIRVRLATLGGMPAGETGCTDPGRISIVAAFVTGRRWHTTRGLEVGHTTARLRRLYPGARYHSRSPYTPPRTWWLVTGREVCLGAGCGRRERVTVPRLAAHVKRGRVVSFVFPVGAQGD